jgi:iron complex transport system ATP-binding protein
VTIAILELENVDVWRWHALSQTRKVLLSTIDWRVTRGEHWVLLGANGAGKTTLLRVAAARSHPSAGRVAIFGEALGRTPVAPLHERIGYVESKLARRFPQTLAGRELVLTGATATLVLLPERIDASHVRRADELLELLAVTHVAERAFADCSDGERMRLLLARALFAEPSLLLLDEPTAGLDLAGREFLLGALARLARERPELTSVVVVHHVEDVPPSTTHALLLRGGEAVAAGPASSTLTDAQLSACFGLPVHVERVRDRWLATVDGHPAA